jgi:catechol 2,3-dioxygenase-like lactoylglutathione lyase family enzyme
MAGSGVSLADREGWAMAIVLDHTIVPSRDKEAGARFLARMLGLEFGGVKGHFAPVRINESLTLDYDDQDGFESHHYAFYVSDEEFDAILGRVQAENRRWGSGPRSHEDGQINRRRGGRGFYFADPDGHLMEVMTRPE